MKKIVCFFSAMIIGTTAAASVCNNSKVIIKNNLPGSVVLGNIKSTSRQGETGELTWYIDENFISIPNGTIGTTTAYNGAEIQPNTRYEFQVGSAAGTHGYASGTVTLGSDQGGFTFDYDFVPYANICKGHLTLYANPKLFDVQETRENGNPAAVTLTIDLKQTPSNTNEE